MIWPSSRKIDAAVRAVEQLRRSRDEQRRQISNDLFGHPGAHIPSVPPPTIRDEVCAALRAIRDA